MDYVFHVLPQTDKNRHISIMEKDINKLYGEKLDIIVGNVSNCIAKLVAFVKYSAFFLKPFSYVRRHAEYFHEMSKVQNFEDIQI